MYPFLRPLLFLLSVIIPAVPGIGQVPSVTPAPEGYRQAITLDLAGNTPFIGASYHHQIIRFRLKEGVYTAGVELSAGLGYIPGFCLFSTCPGFISTHHALLLLYGGKRWQGELGYTGTMMKTFFLF